MTTLIEDRLTHWKASFPQTPIPTTLIDQLAEGWEDNSYQNDESPSILWQVAGMDCCQLYFENKSLWLLDWKDDQWNEFSLNDENHLSKLKSMIEWYLLRLRAFDYFTNLEVKTLNNDVIDEKVGEFCHQYLADRKDLGATASQFWPGEVINEVQKTFAL